MILIFRWKPLPCFQVTSINLYFRKYALISSTVSFLLDTDHLNLVTSVSTLETDTYIE